MKPSVRRRPISFIIGRRLDHRNTTTPVIYSLLPFQRLPPRPPSKPHSPLGKYTLKTAQERRSGFTGLTIMAVMDTNLFIAIQNGVGIGLGVNVLGVGVTPSQYMDPIW